MSGAVPPLTARPLERAAEVPRPVCPGCGWCGRGDPAPAPQRAPYAGWRCALWGWAQGIPGGGAFRRCGGHLGSGAPPPPTARSPGGLSGSATRLLWARVCGCGGPPLAPWLACPVGGHAPRRCRGASGFRRPPFPAARPLGGLPGPAGHALWARVWVCAACVVSVRCVPWCVVSLFVCPSFATLSGALLRCCARRVLAVLPPMLASLARLLATSCFSRGLAARYHFLYSSLPGPPPWHTLFPCLRPGVCLRLSPASLVPVPGSSSFSPIGPCETMEGWGYVGLRPLGTVTM